MVKHFFKPKKKQTIEIINALSNITKKTCAIQNKTTSGRVNLRDESDGPC